MCAGFFVAMPSKADLQDGYLRTSITLEYAWPLFRLSGPQEAVMHLVRASAWGHATRSPGYTCDLRPKEMVAFLEGIWGQAVIYRAIQQLREKTILTEDTSTLTINPRCIQSLPSELLARLDVMIENHNAAKRYSRPQIKAFRHNSTGVEKNSTPVESHYKDRARGEKENKLLSSSFLARETLENAVPNGQQRDDDEQSLQQLQKLKPALLEHASRITRRSQDELAAEIAAVTGRSPRDLALGMARILRGMRSGEIGSIGNLRALLAHASGPNGQWAPLDVAALCSSLVAKAAAPPVDHDAMLAAAIAQQNARRKT